MSKDNKQYKQYEIKDIEHACSVLSSYKVILNHVQ